MGFAEGQYCVLTTVAIPNKFTFLPYILPLVALYQLLFWNEKPWVETNHRRFHLS